MSLFKFLLIVLVVLLVAVPMVTLAQESTPEPVPTEAPPGDLNPVEPAPEETPVVTPETLLGQLYALLKDGTYIAWASAGVVVIVGLIKSVAGGLLGVNITGNGAVLLTLVFQVLIWVGYAAANYFGVGEVFQKNYLVLLDIGRSLLPLAGSIFGSHVLYKAAAKRSVPVLGYRAPEKLYKSAA